MLKTTPPRDWDGFFAWLVEHYWGSVPPEYQTEERPEQLEAPGDPKVPSDIWKSAVMIFSDPEAWLHNPIPNQRNRSPLQLMSRGQGDRLKDILMEVAPFFLAPLDEIRQYGDVQGELSDEEKAEGGSDEAAGDDGEA